MLSRDSKKKEAIFGVFSLFIVGFGQPGWVGWLGPLASCLGYALFWQSLNSISSSHKRFWVASLWFSLATAIQLSWMSSIDYQGIYILFVYSFICLWLGLQFGVLTHLISLGRNLSVLQALAGAGLWTIFEWLRLHILCGFSWNPSGMALAGSLHSLQMAAVWGVFGLSFWVIFTNAVALKVFQSNFSLKTCTAWIAIAFFPYGFGWAHIDYHQKKIEKSTQKLSVCLVQTGLLPHEKILLNGKKDLFLSPFEQWRRILKFVKGSQAPFDLIVLPEGAVPFSCKRAVYPLDATVQILKKELGEEVTKAFPPLEEPFAEKIHGENVWAVSNAFWSSTIATFFQSELIVGLEDQDKMKNYNAAFHFFPGRPLFDRYEKRVLLPLAEYLPFEILRPFVVQYGIVDFFSHGEHPKLFRGKISLSPSICYEETFPNIIREGRAKGAELLVNITNDNWYPNSRLPQQHFEHGRLRAVENGAALLRSCNTGVTAAIDSLGRTVCEMQEKTDSGERNSGILHASLNIYHYPTLYTFWGDSAVLFMSALSLLLFFARKWAAHFF